MKKIYIKREDMGVVIGTIVGLFLSVWNIIDGGPIFISILMLIFCVGLPIIMRKNENNMIKSIIPTVILLFGSVFIVFIMIFLGEYLGILK